MLIYCTDHHCSHLNVVPDDADRWPDELRLSDHRGPLRLHGLRQARGRCQAGLAERSAQEGDRPMMPTQVAACVLAHRESSSGFEGQRTFWMPGRSQSDPVQTFASLEICRELLTLKPWH